jgi:alkanesulfonate monooxygenase SsuD/methylene tetrahydromethanopterin reductase-like flavin-dependent oxidoreductase (luciferase family)
MRMRPIELGYFAVPRGEGDDVATPNPSHRLMLDDAVRAERLGFSSVWVPDHYYFERAGGLETFPEAWTLLTAIGMRTERVRLGTQVLAAGFRHPALLAKMAGALQELSGGRLLLGLGAGNQCHEHNAFDLGFERRIGRFKEYLPIVSALLRGESVTMVGRHYTLRDASLRTFVPEVPIWVAAGGDQMMALTAQYGAGWTAAGGVGWDLDAFRAKQGALAAACRAIGRDVGELEVSHMAFIALAPDAAAARETLDALRAEGRTTPDEIRRRVAVGTPDQVAAAMRQFAELGVNHFVCSLSKTPRPERYWERVELLAKEVLPRVRR